MESGIKRYDLHVHSCYSPCSNLKPKTILKIVRRLELDGIAITDHNTIKGGMAVKKENKEKGFEVIVGEEISTNRGEVIGLYLNEEIEKGIDFFEAIDLIKRQGGLVVIPHPFSFGVIRKSVSSLNEAKDKIDAIECFNGRCFFPWENSKAKKLAKKFDIACTAGSDAHFWFELGNGITMFEKKFSLIEAIRKKKTFVAGTIKCAYLGRGLSLIVKVYQNFFKNGNGMN